MKRHIMSLTYKPKIDSVFDGECRQTIRLTGYGRHLKEVGDTILFHTWCGTPYRSKWGKTFEVTIKEVSQLWFVPLHSWGVLWGINGPRRLSEEDLDLIARHDFIDPPSAENLRKTLKRLSGLKTLEWKIFDIIRW